MPPEETNELANVKPEVTFDDFKKLDIRIGTVEKVQEHPNADKLWLLDVNFGGPVKRIVTGLRGIYEHKDLLGKKIAGLSIFWPDEGLDTGPILLQKKVSIEKDDTLGTLYFNKLYPIGIDAILESIDLIRSGKAPKKPQNHALATYEGWCKSDDVKIDWNADKNSVFDLIRGSDPSPGANTKFENHIVSLFDSQLQDQNPNLPPGTINLITDNSFSIAVRNGNIKVLRVKIDSGRKINSSDFIKDFNIIEGNSFI